MKSIYNLIKKLIILSFFTAPLFSITVEEIITKANIASYYQADDGKAKVKMEITDQQGRIRTREFVILRKDKQDNEDQFFYIYFKKPTDIRKMVFMVWKHSKADDDRWLYLPAMDLVKRIAATDKRTSFAGSDFLYEDVSGRGIFEDKHELIEESESFFKIKNTPLHPENVEFSSYIVWIDKKTFLPLKAEYYDKSLNKYRIVEALETKEIDSHPTIIRSKVTNLETGSSTILEFTDIKYNIGLKNNIFTERFLRRAPKAVRR